jgi:hypothetical protein
MKDSTRQNQGSDAITSNDKNLLEAEQGEQSPIFGVFPSHLPKWLG